MELLQRVKTNQLGITILLVLSLAESQSLVVKDIFNLNADAILRAPRDVKYFANTYERGSARDDQALKPEESSQGGDGTNLEKRCSSCDTGYQNYRSPYDTRYDSRYEGRYQDERYDTRRPSYDRYYDDRDRYDRYDRYNDRNRYYDRDPQVERQPHSAYYDQYDRYDPRERHYSRDRNYDRNSDRGIGYDNAGYDYRGYDSRRGYRPWDETYRGSSGWDSTGRGYYFATGKPEYSPQLGSGYASSWGYGRGDDRDRGWRDEESGRGSYRPRDYYGSTRGTSYLYGRPSSSTTTSTISTGDGNNSVTDAPHDTSSTG